MDHSGITPGEARIISACPKILSGEKKGPQDSGYTAVCYSAQNINWRILTDTFLHEMHNLCTTTTFRVPYAV